MNYRLYETRVAGIGRVFWLDIDGKNVARGTQKHCYVSLQCHRDGKFCDFCHAITNLQPHPERNWICTRCQDEDRDKFNEICSLHEIAMPGGRCQKCAKSSDDLWREAFGNDPT